MQAFPKPLSRVTKGAHPRYQLYQPGFNHNNCCWLYGRWITLPKAEWEARRAKHEEFYKDLPEKIYHQNYRSPGKDPSQLTQAERQAWEFYSGEIVVNCLLHGRAAFAKVETCGPHINERSIAWLREKGYRVLARSQSTATGTVTDQTTLGVPPDLLVETGEPPDMWGSIITQNQERADTLFEGLLARKELGPFPSIIAGQHLLELEKGIIREEYRLSKGLPPDPYTNLTAERAHYSKLRAKLVDAGLLQIYEQNKAENNASERQNLDNSNGTIYCYVLPTFYPDGTHEPWGERDVPWAADLV